MDPKIVTEELANLTPGEKKLIAAVHPVISVYRVKGQQYSYRGQINNFPQDVAEFVTRLPHRITTLSSVLVVRRGKTEQHSDIIVNGHRVLKALKWLQLNNSAYKKITVDDEAVDSLLVNANVMDTLQTVPVNPTDAEIFDEADDNENDRSLQQSEVPVVAEPGQAHRIDLRLKTDAITPLVAWRTTESNAINEFNTEYYITRAFLALFPWETTDSRSPGRKQ